MSLVYSPGACQEILDAATELDWYQRFEIAAGSGVYTPGRHDVQGFRWRCEFVGLTPDLVAGKRVLDIGAYSGAFSFFLRDLGAEVLAVDVYDPAWNGFDLVNSLRQEPVEHLPCSVYDLDPAEIGTFDIVAFYGVHYHLRHPILAFERCNQVCRDGGLLIGGGTGMDAWFHDDHPSCQRGANLEAITWDVVGDEKILGVHDLNELPLAGFAAGHFLRDRTNWFLPNLSCLLAWVTSCGFKLEKSFKAMGDLVRDWNRDGLIRRSTHNFVAIKEGEPRPEYDLPTMRPYSIPTEARLARLEARIAELEEALAAARQEPGD